MIITAAQLIAQLQTLPPDRPMLVDGYEGGYDPFTLQTRRVTQAPELRSDYLGVYDDVYPDDGDEGTMEVTVLSRRDNNR